MKKNSELFTFEFDNVKNSNIDFQILDTDELLNSGCSLKELQKPHKLDFNVIFIIYEGTGKHYVDFKLYSCDIGTALFIAKNQVTSFDLSSSMKYYTLEFSDEFFSKLSENNLLDMFDFMRYKPTLRLDKNTLQSMLKNIELLNLQLKLQKDEFSENIVQFLFKSLLLQLKRDRIKNTTQITAKDAKIYNDFIKFLRDSHDYTKKVGDYARSLQISSKTLTRILKKYANKTAKTYLDEYLLLQIKRYLQNDEMTLQSISDRLNFDEVTNLVKFFKKFERITPSEFKNSLN